MPWVIADVEGKIKGLSAVQKAGWVSIANSTLADCLKKGGSQPVCEGRAIRIANAMAKTVREGIQMRLLEVSSRSWATVDKSKLPASCFLWVEDEKKKATWHLPIYEGAGAINPETGMYGSRGQLNLNALRAASAAIAGARAGRRMTIPANIRARLTALLKANKIGQFAENIKEKKREKETGTKDITYLSNLKETTIDKDNKIVRDVVLMSRFARNSENKIVREYTPECLDNAVNIFNGIKAFANHPGKNEGKFGRDVRDLIGKYENVRVVDNRLKGDLNLLDSATWVMSLAEKMPDIAGNSIHAQGRVRRNDKGEIVEQITKAYSVDLVTDPATTYSLFENKEENKKEGKMEWKDISLVELQANRPDLHETILAEGVASRNEEVKTLTDERDKLKKDNDTFTVKEALTVKGVLVDKLLKESNLPEEAKTDTFRETLMAIAEKKDGDKVTSIETQVKNLIEDRKDVITGKKGVKKNGEKTVLKEGQEIPDAAFVSIVKSR